MFRQALAGLVCATALTTPAIAQTYETEAGAVALDPVVEGLQFPWGMVFLPDDSMLVTERSGNLRHVAADGTISDPITGVPEVVFEGQGGLLDVALDPEFESNRYVYVSYAEPGDEAGTNSTAVARGVLSEDRSQLSDVEVIFSQQPKLPSTLHFGSRLTFDNDGYLFILPDGSVPEDNPFVDTQGALPEIWSYGHRNMQGADMHPQTDQLWVAEHGPRGGDELNKVVPGGNYGWPLLTEGTEYSGDPINPPQDLPDDLVEAERTWVPSPAPSGLAFYTGDLFPQWQGDAFMGALAGTDLIRIDLEGEEVLGDEFLFGDGFPHRIRDVTEGPDGALYLITDADPGQILRLSPEQ